MARQKYVLGALGVAAAGFLVAGMFAKPTLTAAMPNFAQAYGVSCSTCHTQVPLLNAYGRYVQRTGYASLDRTVLARALPIWLGENVNYDSSQQPGSGIAKFSFANLAIHGAGYIAPDITFHLHQWVVQDENSGGVDTFWVTYNKLFNRDGHLFVGKILNPAPAFYSQDFEIDGASASGTVVGEHDWGATYDNRWGARFAYARKALDVEVGYYLSGQDLNGLTDFGVRFDTTTDPPTLTAGDKTFQWKVAYARPDVPVEFGVFGSRGVIPVSTGTDQYSSIAGYVQVDPSRHGRPGLFAVYQAGRDGNPGGVGADGVSPLPAGSSKGVSVALFEHVFNGAATIGLRHDVNDDGLGTVTNGNSLNLAFNIPHYNYAHVFLEANTGGNSALPGVNGSPGPTWKGQFWLDIPIAKLR
jgi:hypothetical protein